MVTIETLLQMNRQQRERIEELEERILQMTPAKDVLPPGLPYLTPMEEAMLRVLLSGRGVVTRDQLLDGVYGDKAGEPPDPDIFRVVVHRLRRKVGHIVRIVTVWGRGYLTTVIGGETVQ